MKSVSTKLIVLTVILTIISSACLSSSPFSSLKDTVDKILPGDDSDLDSFDDYSSVSALIPEDIPNNGIATLLGEFEYSNEFYPEEYAYEHSVMLLDMNGFIQRDREWEIPVESQILGYTDMDTDNNRATFSLQLPLQPAGTFNDLDNDDSDDRGVQVFAVEYAPNWTGGPFYTGDDPYRGWPQYLASVLSDSENDDEIIGGKLLVWSPDNDQSFPSGFGEDGLLFTGDDPVMTISEGYTIVDLDTTPFETHRDRVYYLTLLEPMDAAVKDFSDLSYTEAFNKMFDTIKTEYAFKDIPDKSPDWDALYDDLYPRVEKTQEDDDPYGFFLVIREFMLAFRDGHVYMDGGDLELEYIYGMIYSGYGFAIRELDDGRSLIVHVTRGGPADQAGIQIGSEITHFNNIPITEAISQVPPFSSQSTEFGLRYEQAQFLLRAPIDKEADITFLDLNGNKKTVTVTADRETESFFATSLYSGFDDIAPPVEYDILPVGYGYIVIHSNSDDLNLTYRLFERALQIFEENEVSKLIIDMRANGGGANLGLAGYLTDEDIEMGQLEYFSEKSGQFEAEGEPDLITPFEEQYEFDKMVLLVDQTCFSACELDAYGFSQVPNMTVMGQYPTGGVEAETARGKFILPESIELTVPTGRFTLADGSIFLEGVGVKPDVKIPIDDYSVLSSEDTVLDAAIEYLLQH